MLTPMCVRRSTRSTTPSLVTGLGDGGADAKARDRALRQQAKEKRAFEADRKAFRAEMAAMRQDQQAQHDAFLQMMATMNQRNTGASSSLLDGSRWYGLSLGSDVYTMRLRR